MKIKIDKKAKFGDKEFPYKEILSICFGTFGLFIFFGILETESTESTDDINDYFDDRF